MKWHMHLWAPGTWRSSQTHIPFLWLNDSRPGVIFSSLRLYYWHDQVLLCSLNISALSSRVFQNDACSDCPVDLLLLPVAAAVRQLWFAVLLRAGRWAARPSLWPSPCSWSHTWASAAGAVGDRHLSGSTLPNDAASAHCHSDMME